MVRSYTAVTKEKNQIKTHKVSQLSKCVWKSHFEAFKFLKDKTLEKIRAYYRLD